MNVRRRWKRFAGLSIGLIMLAAGVLYVGHTQAVQSIELTMQSRGMTWEARSHSWRTLRWNGLSTPIGTVESIQLDLVQRKLKAGVITLAEPDRAVDKSVIKTQSSDEPDPVSPNWTPFRFDQLRIEPSDIRIDMGDSLPFDGSVVLSTQPSSEWSLTRTTRGDWKLRGTEVNANVAAHQIQNITVEALASNPPVFTIEIPSLHLDHPLLSREPLPDHPMRIRAELEENGGIVKLTASYGRVSGQASIRRAGDVLTVHASIPQTPLTEIAAIFGDTIPEQSSMQIEGTLGLEARIEGPPWTWTAEPSVNELKASGGLPPSMGLNRVQFAAGSTVHVVGPSIDGWVPLANAGWFPEAVIAAEDIRFETHPGFDIEAIQEAIDAAPNEDRIRGGSTITQQLAKNLFLDGRRTLCRKLRELLLALSLEDRMSKDGILQLYINVVEFGPNLRGIEQASRAWFLKAPDQLTPREAAFLAAILPAPNGWHERIKRTGKPPVVVVDRVLDNMRRKKVISAEEHRRERKKRLRIVPP